MDLTDSNKLLEDYEAARDWRGNKVIPILNQRFSSHRDVVVSFWHRHSKTMDRMELARKDTFVNRTDEVDIDSAVGLDLRLEHASGKERRLIVRRFVDPDIYLKIPVNIEVSEYVASLKKENALLVFFNEECTRYFLLPFKQISGEWLRCNKPNQARAQLCSVSKLASPRAYGEGFPIEGGSLHDLWETIVLSFEDRIRKEFEE